MTDGDAQRDYGNTWQAATQAAEGGFMLVDTALFDAAAGKRGDIEPVLPGEASRKERAFR